MNYKHISGPEQPSVFTHGGKYRELAHTTPATNNSITRETVAKIKDPAQALAYAAAAIADNLAGLTDMIDLRGEELRTELAQLAENTLPRNDAED